MLTAYHPPPRERRYAGLALTVLVHALLLVGLQMSRHARPVESGPEPVRTRIQWIRLPAPAPAAPAALPKPKPAVPPAPSAPSAPIPERAAPAVTPPPAAAQPAAIPSAAPAISVVPAAPAAPVTDAARPAAPASASGTAAPTPSTADILRGAKRDIGKIDRAVRKENNPYIVLPPDSPQIRLRKGMEAAHDAVPPKLWEAPAVDELVNDTGDGARRARVRTGLGTYCITDRPLNTSIDMIEKHGKQRLTTCPEHEQPSTKQDWRSARD